MSVDDCEEEIKKYLTMDTDRYNIKTVQLSVLTKKYAVQPPFINIRKLSFLPPEFIQFLNVYVMHPDPFVKIQTYEQFMMQYWANELMPDQVPKYYKLFHRTIYTKIVATKICMVYIHTMHGHRSFGIYKNFKRTIIGPNIIGWTFKEALHQFYTLN